MRVPLGLDHPYWIEDPKFDLGFHIRDTAVPPPGDDHALAETVSRIFARPLDRRRPLWELYVIHGIENGLVGLLTKVHHAAVDGVSGAEILGVIFDLEAEAPPENVPPPRFTPERRPSELEMLGRGLVGLTRQPVRAMRSLPDVVSAGLNFPGAAMMPGVPLLQKARAETQKFLGSPSQKALVEMRASRPPKTRFNAPVTPHRRFSFGSVDLERVKALKNELGIKVNDVVVALVAGGVRDWMLEQGELPDDPLVALVPVSVRSEEEMGTFGNKVTGMILPIPTDVADPRKRLMRAHEVLMSAKDQNKGLPASLMTDVSNFLPPAIFSRASRIALEVSGRFRPALNLIISNVPGPPVPLYCAGGQMVAHHPVSVITHGVGLNVTVMSYRDKLDFGIVVDHDMVDDAWPLMDAMRKSLDEMADAVLGAEPQPPALSAT